MTVTTGSGGSIDGLALALADGDADPGEALGLWLGLALPGLALGLALPGDALGLPDGEPDALALGEALPGLALGDPDGECDKETDGDAEFRTTQTASSLLTVPSPSALQATTLTAQAPKFGMKICSAIDRASASARS